MSATNQARLEALNTGITSDTRSAPAGGYTVHALVAAGLVLLVVVATVLFAFGGWEYYRAPLASRVYLPQHRLLRPSGPVGLTLGIAGAVAMLSTLPYAIRKRWRRLAKLGSMRGWLEVHIFFGVVGPILITLHTSFKFNGLISAGYWLMMAVWASGFVGRYLYVRIPKSIRGAELSRQEIEAHLQGLRQQMETASPSRALRETLDAFHGSLEAPGRAAGWWDLFFGELRVRARLLTLRRQLRGSGVDSAHAAAAIALAAERIAITRRLVHLQRTRHLFELWHVFHRPLVSALFVIVALHIGIAVYFGYVGFSS
jgi:hypothetical protein